MSAITDKSTLVQKMACRYVNLFSFCGLAVMFIVGNIMPVYAGSGTTPNKSHHGSAEHKKESEDGPTKGYSLYPLLNTNMRPLICNCSVTPPVSLGTYSTVNHDFSLCKEICNQENVCNHEIKCLTNLETIPPWGNPAWYCLEGAIPLGFAEASDCKE